MTPSSSSRQPAAARRLRSDRLREIADYARESGTIRVSDLAERLGVTEVTIRRDLSSLERQGVLEREHGGAVALRGAESEFGRRMALEREAKEAIARYAARYVADGATIVIDSGSTMARFARQLRGKRDLKVVTNAITTAAEIAEYTDATIIMTGGVIRRSTLGAVGDIAVQTLGGLRADIAFIACAGIVADGLTYPALDEVAVKRAMIESAAEVILLADHTKFGRVSLGLFARLKAVDRIVTSGRPPAELATAIGDAGVELVVVEQGRPAEATRARLA